MRDMDDKEMLEQINAIRADAENISVSENIAPKQMMKRLEESCFEESIQTKKRVKNRKIRRWVATYTGVAATVAVAILTIVLIVNDMRPSVENMGIGNTNKGVIDTYADQMKVEVDNGIYVLSGYKELNEYRIVAESCKTENNYHYKDDVILNDMLDGSVMEDIAEDFEVSDDEFDEQPTMSGKPDSNNGSYEDESAKGDVPEGDYSDEDDEKDYSDTNVRTEGVAEADVVKTDGEYIYHFIQKEVGGNTVINLTITKADGTDSKVVSEVSLYDEIYDIVSESIKEDNMDCYVDATVADLLVCGDKLVVVTTPSVYYKEVYDFNEIYYYDNIYTSSIVLTYDIQDRTKPELYSSLTFEGVYDSCKMVDGYVYIFADLYKNEEMPDEQCSEEEAASLYAPKVCDDILPAENVYVTDSQSYNMYHIIAVMNTSDLSKFHDVKAIIGEEGSIKKYVSGQNIYYITDIGYDYQQLDEIEEGNPVSLSYKSQIMRFSYNKGDIEATGCALIDGNVGDEFDIDEYNGYLRMAVSTEKRYVRYDKVDVKYYNGIQWAEGYDYEPYIYNWSGDESVSALYIYDSNLQLVGSIPELQKEEEVYGVRFDGDVAYIVTYRQTDPLFTVDLSDPTKPTVMSALKIPGFSTYLHKWDDNKLIGLGYDEWGYIKISTFDISDKYDVKETDVCSIDDAYWSEALYNHRAVFISPEKNLIGFAAEGYVIDKDTGNGTYKMLYRIFSYVEDELTEVIQCEIDKYTTNIRGLYIGDYIYIVSPTDGITVYNMSSYEQVAQTN